MQYQKLAWLQYVSKDSLPSFPSGFIWIRLV